MYKLFTKTQALALTAVAVGSLMAASTVFAKDKPEKPFAPGKPGELTLLGTALDYNSKNTDMEGVGEFTYLYQAVLCLEEPELSTVVGLLTGEDDYTLFAPTNDAFRALQGVLAEKFELDIEPAPEVTCAVDTLLGDGTLYTVLAYHLTEGRRFSNSVFNRNNPKEIDMLAGGFITSTPSLTIIDGAMQTAKPNTSLVNIKASNGVIHVIDTVLLPFAP
jgi:uncharacterized surface protein with fasciclin (FAS1) repeats